MGVRSAQGGPLSLTGREAAAWYSAQWLLKTMQEGKPVPQLRTTTDEGDATTPPPVTTDLARTGIFTTSVFWEGRGLMLGGCI